LLIEQDGERGVADDDAGGVHVLARVAVEDLLQGLEGVVQGEGAVHPQLGEVGAGANAPVGASLGFRLLRPCAIWNQTMDHMASTPFVRVREAVQPSRDLRPHRARSLWRAAELHEQASREIAGVSWAG
jgi:hypothetical protein